MWQAAFSLEPAALERRTRWIIAALLVAAVAWGLTDVRKRGALDPNHVTAHMTDFTCFTEAGAAFFDGRDPYRVTNARGWEYYYPPLFALFVAPLARFDTQIQCLVWYALSVLMCYGCYYESRRLWRHFLAPDDSPRRDLAAMRSDAAATPTRSTLSSRWLLWLPWIAAATVAFPVLNCLQRGQVGVAKAYFLLLGLRWLYESRQRRWAFAAGVVFIIPIVIKITPILPVGILALGIAVEALWSRRKRDWRRAASLGTGLCAGMFLFFWLIPACILGWQSNQRYLSQWYREVATRANDLNHADRCGNTRTIRNQSLSNALYRGGNWVAYEFFGGQDDRLSDNDQFQLLGLMPMDAPAVEKLLYLLRNGLALLAVAGMVRMARLGDQLGMAAMFGLATAATLIVAPIGRAHYFMLLLPAIFLVPLWFRRRGETRWARFSAGLPLVLCVAHYAALDYAGRIGLLGLGTTVWYAAVTAKLLFAKPSANSAVLQTPVAEPSGSAEPPAPRSGDSRRLAA
ncbi:MAG TPA: glycosyltransferase family 87 protein [Pirellulales bacterium]|jgi:hypothetical protein|nr:glycosyltransferase family 87 protein [Pirellulales bacterium]